VCGRRVGLRRRAAIPGTNYDSCMHNNSPEDWRRAMQAAEGRRADAMVLGFFAGSVVGLGGAAACGRLAVCRWVGDEVEMGEGGGGRAPCMPACGRAHAVLWCGNVAAQHAVGGQHTGAQHVPRSLPSGVPHAADVPSCAEPFAGEENSCGSQPGVWWGWEVLLPVAGLAVCRWSGGEVEMGEGGGGRAGFMPACGGRMLCCDARCGQRWQRSMPVPNTSRDDPCSGETWQA